MDSEHRPVELQSPLDLTFLRHNAERIARQKIDLNFPPAAAPEGEDELRRRVEEYVEKYLEEVFSQAKKNISVNGMPATDLTQDQVAGETEEFEAFDNRLLGKVRELSAQRDMLMERVAAMRTNAPAAASRNFQTAYNAHASALDAEAQNVGEAAVKQGEDGGKLNVQSSKRQEEMQRTYRNATEELDNLNKGLGGTVGRLERAVGVVKEEESR